MHNHFDKNLNLKKFILERKPKLIVECGAGNGENTKLLVTLAEQYDFQLDVINDKKIEGMDPAINWKVGLSYNILTEYPADSIGLCIIDTDHNYWTLMKELTVLSSRIVEGGMIAMHDVETFYHDTGLALSYFTGDPYPKEEIDQVGSTKGSMGDALIEFLSTNRFNYRLLGYTHESHGAALLIRDTLKTFQFYLPGKKPIYAQPSEVVGAAC